MRRLASFLGKLLLLAGLYIATADLGLHLGAINRFATLVWPPTGIALAALFLFGGRLWPAVAVGAFTINLVIGGSIPEAAGIALGNTLEALAGSYALQRLRVHAELDRLRDVLAVVVVAGVLSTGVSAGIGVLSLVLGGTVAPAHAPDTLQAWWLGDLMGDLVVAPFLLTWIGTRRSFLPRLKEPVRWAEGVLFGLVSSWIALTVFGPTPLETRALLGVYLLFPVLAWAALRFGPRGVSATALLVSLVAIYGTAEGHGPFVRETLSVSLFPLQSFVAVVAVTALILAAAMAERNAAVRSRESIAAIVSHDLRSPLSAVRISADNLLRSADDDRIRRHVDLVARSSGRMEALITDLLDLSAIEGGHLSIAVADVPVDGLLQEAVDLLRPLAAAKSQQLTTEMAGPSVLLRCDRKRTLQILSNLIGNAVKFAPEHGLVAVQSRVSRSFVRFCVSDNGPGLEKDVIERVFEPFWQAQRDEQRGVGLGLSIAKGIVLTQGGRIWVRSKLGRGATFCFTLRRVPERFRPPV